MLHFKPVALQVGKASWPTNFRDLLSPSFSFNLFYIKVLEIKFRSSWLQGKHFTKLPPSLSFLLVFPFQSLNISLLLVQDDLPLSCMFYSLEISHFLKGTNRATFSESWHYSDIVPGLSFINLGKWLSISSKWSSSALFSLSFPLETWVKRVRPFDDVPSFLVCSVVLFHFALFSVLSFSLWSLVCDFYSAVFQLAHAVLESAQSFVEKEKQ